MTRNAPAGLAAGLLLAGLLAGCTSVPPPTAELDAADRATHGALPETKGVPLEELAARLQG